MKILQVLALSFFLSGCTIYHAVKMQVHPNVQQSISLSHLKPNHGVLIMATRFSLICEAVDPLRLGVGVEGGLFSNTWPWGGIYINDGKEQNHIALYQPFNKNLNRDYRSPSGHFQVLELPAGQYYFDRIQAHQDSSSSISLDIASLPFTVEPGKAIYIGEISVHMTECDYWAAPRATAKYRISVTNQWSRDSRILKSRYPNIKENEVALAITHI